MHAGSAIARYLQHGLDAADKTTRSKEESPDAIRTWFL